MNAASVLFSPRWRKGRGIVLLADLFLIFYVWKGKDNELSRQRIERVF